MDRRREEAIISFFMPVVEKNIALTDFCVRSYAKIRDIPFVLIVYLNGVGERGRIYAGRWRKLRFVKVVDPGNESVTLPHFEVLDRELKKIQTPYFATVDSDFEILNAGFVTEMLRRLDENENLAAVSTDLYNKNYRFPKRIKTLLMPCWNAWFVIYKRKALQCPVSHAPHSGVDRGTGEPVYYDVSARFQEALIRDHGFTIGALEREYRSSFIHYGSMAWGKKWEKRSLTRTGALLFRWLKILSKNGLWGRGRIIVQWADALVKKF